MQDSSGWAIRGREGCTIGVLMPETTRPPQPVLMGWGRGSHLLLSGLSPRPAWQCPAASGTKSHTLVACSRHSASRPWRLQTEGLAGPPQPARLSGGALPRLFQLLEVADCPWVPGCRCLSLISVPIVTCGLPLVCLCVSSCRDIRHVALRAPLLWWTSSEPPTPTMTPCLNNSAF